MTSSLIKGAARTRYLLDLLSQVPDPRKRRGRRHQLAGLLAVGAAAVIAGSRSFAAIGQWAADAGPDVLAALGADRGPADESTYRRAFALVSADVLDQVLGAWLFTRAVRAAGRLVIAVDGKAVRGREGQGREGPAPGRGPRARHRRGPRPGRREREEQRDPRRPGPAGRVRRPGRGGHHPGRAAHAARHRPAHPRPARRLRDDRQGQHAHPVPAAQEAALAQGPLRFHRDDGPRPTRRRTVKVILAPAWIEFEGAAQVAQLRRTVTKKGKKTVEIVYVITSDRRADPATLAAWVKGHWEIENKLHWVRDVTYQEDKSLVRTGNAPRVMASLRSLAVSLLRLGGHANIAAANRHHARDPQRTLKLLQAA